jgi:hypothetical protein
MDELNKVSEMMREFVRDKIAGYSKSPPPALHHYTTPEGLIGIVTKRELWASEITSLADGSEVSYPVGLIKRVFKNECPDLPCYEKRKFIEGLETYSLGPLSRFIACFCEEEDLLSQWRGYGADGDGFSIGFKSEALKTLRVAVAPCPWRLVRVLYDVADQEGWVKEYIRSARRICDERSGPVEPADVWWSAGASLAQWIIAFKNPKFSEESEWRVANEQGALGSKWDPAAKVCYRRAGRRIVRYTALELADRPIARVRMGPFFDAGASRSIQRMLEGNHFGPDIPVVQSDIPLHSP